MQSKPISISSKEVFELKFLTKKIKKTNLRVRLMFSCLKINFSIILLSTWVGSSRCCLSIACISCSHGLCACYQLCCWTSCRLELWSIRGILFCFLLCDFLTLLFWVPTGIWSPSLRCSCLSKHSRKSMPGWSFFESPSRLQSLHRLSSYLHLNRNLSKWLLYRVLSYYHGERSLLILVDNWVAMKAMCQLEFILANKDFQMSNVK